MGGSAQSIFLKMAAKPYQRLPGRGRRTAMAAVSATRNTLWLGPDHLLSLDFTVASESYRRFYFRDIEALVIRRTKARSVWNYVFLILLLLSAGPLLFMAFKSAGPGGLATVAQAGSPGFAWFLSGVLALVLWILLILINTLRGPTCAAHIRTAAQIENLPSLNRESVVRKVMARLRPKIEEAQGVVALERIAAADWSASPAGGAKLPEPSYREGAPKPIRHVSGRLHAWLFAILLTDSGVTFWDVLQETKFATGLNLVLTLAGVFVLIFALRRQSNSDLPHMLQRMTWGALAYYLAGFAVGFAYTVSYPIRHDGQAADTTANFFRGEPGFLQVMIVSGIVSLLLGLAGLLALTARRSAPQPPPIP